MFKKDISPGSKSKVKSSVQRAIRTQITSTYPLLAPHIDEIIPKKEQLDAMKIPDRITLYLINTTPIFYQHMTDPILPHLRLVHRFPHCFPALRIDRGAIRFVLSGATLMAPGLTSTMGRLPSGNEEETGTYGEDTSDGDGGGGGDGGENGASGDKTNGVTPRREGWYGGRELLKGEPVVIWAEGKREPCATGLLTQGTKDVKEDGKGPVVEDAHFLGDGLWKLHTE